ncbi:hypothetical protein Pfo_028951 [Paulownia fortunei]|nr:hypothetical protein Pfo_028951 [Paulownia fortunei]
MVSSTKLSLILFFACYLLVQRTRGDLREFAYEPLFLCDCIVGKRCVLENYLNERGSLDYTCKTSEVVVERLSGYIETDHCVNACGVDREFVGISSDAFLTADFTARLCSPACYQNCPNIVDLYFNLAAGEALCEKQKANPHRAMLELLSSGGGVAPGPVAADYIAAAPASAPASF